ncbi:MAG: hypothetical protein AB7I18_05975 [Candidatus Berkiella sp.]
MATKGARRTTPAFLQQQQQQKALNELAKENIAPAPAKPVASTPDDNDPKQKHKDEVKRKKKALAERIRQKDMVIRAMAPQNNPGDTGAIGKAEHLAGLTAEGVAGEMIMDLMIFSVELTFNTPFWIQAYQFDEALKKELSSTDGVRLAYLPDDNGVYPEIYPVDGQGNVDYKQQPIQDQNEITPFHIRANGYVPRPSITESLMVVFDRHIERMLGSGALTPDQKARMHNTVAQMKNDDDKNEKDATQKMQDDRAAQMAAMRAVPKPG